MAGVTNSHNEGTLCLEIPFPVQKDQRPTLILSVLWRNVDAYHVPSSHVWTPIATGSSVGSWVQLAGVRVQPAGTVRDRRRACYSLKLGLPTQAIWTLGFIPRGRLHSIRMALPHTILAGVGMWDDLESRVVRKSRSAGLPSGGLPKVTLVVGNGER